MRWLTRVAPSLTTLAGLILLVPLALNAWVVGASDSSVFNRGHALSADRVALVLGTSPYLRDGQHNVFFTQRIVAAARLYQQGVVAHLLVSGANPSTRYNEPRRMYQQLIALGVPPHAITLDFAGFRTLDSVVRARRIFGVNQAIIVTQRFHAYRAVFLASRNGVDAMAFVASNRRTRLPFEVAVREYFARVQSVLDVYVFHTDPRYLGPARPIGADGGDRSRVAIPRDLLL
ncbi:DUF218 domain-containing protein [Salinisphaera sp. USBA-960]|nr:DUF218 domain-containing protein [Salifodinibacter halophilus]NNC26492.1 DUF218 domain-containing protein [Salifodinibacter halophilus]